MGDRKKGKKKWVGWKKVCRREPLPPTPTKKQKKRTTGNGRRRQWRKQQFTTWEIRHGAGSAGGIGSAIYVEDDGTMTINYIVEESVEGRRTSPWE